MTPKQKNTVLVCFVILTISIIIMAINMILDINKNGMDVLNMGNILPFIGIALAMITILTSTNNKKL